jgi:phosphate transport system substrate-binding protein
VNWNDPAIAKVNPGVNFPNTPIIVIYRSDGSGTTFIFTDYLSKISKEWSNIVGKGTSVKWPGGMGGKGNEGVAGQVRQLSGSIGYVELIYAVQNKITYGSVRNAAGNFVAASLDGVTEAAATAKTMPADFPISSFTWLLIPNPAKDPKKGKIIADFLDWMVTDGQKMTSQLSYAPLPDSVVEKVKAAIKQVH